MPATKILHLISFDVPYPPNYGGIVDVYYKIEAFKNSGVKIILHCFYKGERPQVDHLGLLCDQVFLYPRKLFNIVNKLPYIVSSRVSKELIKNLSKDSYPILIEGIHCTSFLLSMDCSNRQVALRTHNIEHEYYQGLKVSTSSLLKKIYFELESKRLQKYEKSISTKLNHVFPLSQKDVQYFKNVFNKSNVLYTSAFYDSSVTVCKPKEYILLQGNFDVSENLIAALYLIQSIAPLAKDQNFVIAGKNANKIGKNACQNITIINSPSVPEMFALNKEAKATLVYSTLNAGVKLKILNALAAGVPVFCNADLYLDPYLTSCLTVYRDPKELIDLLLKIDKSINYRLLLQEKFKRVFNLEHFSSQIISQLFI